MTPEGGWAVKKSSKKLVVTEFWLLTCLFGLPTPADLALFDRQGN